MDWGHTLAVCVKTEDGKRHAWKDDRGELLYLTGPAFSRREVDEFGAAMRMALMGAEVSEWEDFGPLMQPIFDSFYSPKLKKVDESKASRTSPKIV
jgi:hypothetical protein